MIAQKENYVVVQEIQNGRVNTVLASFRENINITTKLYNTQHGEPSDIQLNNSLITKDIKRIHVKMCRRGRDAK